MFIHGEFYCIFLLYSIFLIQTLSSVRQGMNHFSKPARYLFMEIQKIDSSYYPEVDFRVNFVFRQSLSFISYAYPYPKLSSSAYLPLIMCVQTLHLLFIVNAGPGFRVLWKVIKALLDTRTLAKIRVSTF